MDTLIQRLSKVVDATPATTADEVDKLIHKIIRKLRQGESARLPGLGTFAPSDKSGNKTQFSQEASGEHRRSKSRRAAGKNS